MSKDFEGSIPSEYNIEEFKSEFSNTVFVQKEEEPV